MARLIRAAGIKGLAPAKFVTSTIADPDSERLGVTVKDVMEHLAEAVRHGIVQPRRWSSMVNS